MYFFIIVIYTSGQPGKPGTPGTPGTPGLPAGPFYQKPSPAAGYPGSPGAPGQPGTPGLPGIPAQSFGQSPQVLVDYGKPNLSTGYPGSAGQPGLPGQPGTPGTPGTPGIPASYPTSSKPSQYPINSGSGSVSSLPSNGYPSYTEQNYVYPTSYPQKPNVPGYGSQQPNVYPEYLSSGYPVPPPSNAPLPNYPQSNEPSGYPGFYELYPGQNQIYSGQLDFNAYPSVASEQYPFNGNVYGYPEQQFTYPATENKKPQVTTPVSTQTSGSKSKSSQTSPEYTSKPSLIDIRINVPNKPDSNEGQKAVTLGNNELIGPSSGSSGHSSSLNPQYVNSPTKGPKLPYQFGQKSNQVISSSSKPETSTPLYSISTKTALTPENNNLVVSTSTVSYEEQFTTLSPDSSTPVNIIPYPLPIVPNPGSCPCYFVPPTNNSTNQLPQQPTLDLNNLPEGAVIGFVPVVFYPSCGTGTTVSKEVVSSKLNPVFPSAYQVPYKCSYCEQSESQTATIRGSFDQVVKQSQLNPSVVIKSPSRKNYPNAPIYDQQEFGRKIKVVRRKTKDE
uniref:Accumulation-associated protein n=1 Tax=Melanaphis sacchari TaxID=742174 RepID=A0A2H8U1D4_9HEMI